MYAMEKKRVIWGAAIGLGTLLAGSLAVPRVFGGKGPAEEGLAPSSLGIRDSVRVILSLGLEQLWVGARRGLYRSTDQGSHWKRIFQPGIAGGQVQGLALDPVDPSRILVAAGTRLYASLNKGQRWELLYRSDQEILTVAVDPRDSRRIFVGTLKGLRISSDQGFHWNAPGGGLSEVWIRSVLFHPSRPGYSYLWTQRGLFRSKDQGSSWQRIWGRVSLEEEAGVPLAVLSDEEREESLESTGNLAIDPAEGILYIGTDQGIFSSRDDGQSWESLPTLGLGTPRILQLLVLPQRPRALCAATREGLFLFNPDTGIWNRLAEGLPSGPIDAVALTPEGHSVWAGTRQGLFQIALPASSPLRPMELSERERVSAEPSIQEVLEAAIQYAEVMPGKIRGWRAGAVLRNWFPRFTVSLDRDKDQTIASATSGGKTTFSMGPEDKSVSVGFGFTWDLANLVWNPDQVSIDTRSRLMVQLRQDILEEVTRLYFERKRLLSEFQGNPTQDPLLRTERSLRIEELTARLDALTGNRFSEEGCRSPKKPIDISKTRRYTPLMSCLKRDESRWKEAIHAKGRRIRKVRQG